MKGPPAVAMPASAAAPVAVRQAGGAQDIGVARVLFETYAAALGVDLCFQNFALELASLPGDYAPPRGRLLLALRDDVALGCVALRPLAAPDRRSGSVGEVKRLYVKPQTRGQGIARLLVSALLGEARTIGYRELWLDTLPSMAEAQSLYRSVGFRPIAPYYANPLPGVDYLGLVLSPNAQNRISGSPCT
jgi:putative acetyltransferase